MTDVIELLLWWLQHDRGTLPLLNSVRALVMTARAALYSDAAGPTVPIKLFVMSREKSRSRAAMPPCSASDSILFAKNESESKKSARIDS
ncbi:hypothetical protein [Bradyrhizobium ivorense]|uniref:hypothetical protein n=1 Tax=Bradyrhizobium ivorense TaxID=2511166 RepID=UPI001116A321|nr:hypothetical protein [Bradyrhizobium ivorense]